MHILSVLSLVVLLLAGQALAQPSWAFSLVGVPGVSLGPVSIGMTQAMVFNRLGIPQEISREVSDKCGPGCEDIYWIYKISDETVFAVSWTTRPDVPEIQTGLDWLMSNSPRTTVGGIQINSKLKQVVERYGWWEYRRGRWYSWKIGFRVFVVDEEEVKAIAIMERSVE